MSRVVVVGTSADEEAAEALGAPPSVARRSDVAPRQQHPHEDFSGLQDTDDTPPGSPMPEDFSSLGSVHPGAPIATPEAPWVSNDIAEARAQARESRAAARLSQLGITRIGSGVNMGTDVASEGGVAGRGGPIVGADDEDEEATTVDAGAALSDDDRDALLRRIQSALGETLPIGTPPPQPVQRRVEPASPEETVESARDRRNIFKQTILHDACIGWHIGGAAERGGRARLQRLQQLGL